MAAPPECLRHPFRLLRVHSKQCAYHECRCCNPSCTIYLQVRNFPATSLEALCVQVLACQNGANAYGSKAPDYERQRAQPQRCVVELHKSPEQDDSHLRSTPGGLATAGDVSLEVRPRRLLHD